MDEAKGKWSRKPGSDFETNKDEGGINLEGGLGDDGSADVHERVEDVAQVRRRPLQRDDKAVAAQTFISQVQQGDDALAQIDGGSTLAIYVERLGFAGKLQDDSVVLGAKVWGRYGNPASTGQRLEPILGKEGHEEVQCIVLVDGLDRAAAGGAAIAAKVGDEGWRR